MLSGICYQEGPLNPFHLPGHLGKLMGPLVALVPPCSLTLFYRLHAVEHLIKELQIALAVSFGLFFVVTKYHSPRSGPSFCAYSLDLFQHCCLSVFFLPRNVYAAVYDSSDMLFCIFPICISFNVSRQYHQAP